MRVETILRSKGSAVATIDPGASVAIAAHRMSGARIGCLVVSRDGSHVDGLVTERDLVRAMVKSGSEAPSQRVADVMSTDPPSCRARDDLTTVMAMMTNRHYRHVPVLDAGRLAGIVSIGDLVKHRLNELELERSVLRDMASH